MESREPGDSRMCYLSSVPAVCQRGPFQIRLYVSVRDERLEMVDRRYMLETHQRITEYSEENKRKNIPIKGTVIRCRRCASTPIRDDLHGDGKRR